MPHHTSPRDPSERDFLTSGEVARILSVSPKTVARWAQAGKLPHFVTLGGHRRFPARTIYAMAGGVRARGVDVSLDDSSRSDISLN